MKATNHGLMLLTCIGMFIVSIWSVSFGLSMVWSTMRSQHPSACIFRSKGQPPQNHASGDHKNSCGCPNFAVATSESHESSDTAQCGTPSPSNKWSDPITLFTAALVILGLVQCIIYGLQRKTMELSRTALELAERAEIQVTEVSLTPFNRFQPQSRLFVKFKNFGRTVATEVYASIKFHDMPSATTATTQAILAPQVENSFVVDLDTINGPISAEKLTQFESGACPFRIVIEFNFTDIFERTTTNLYDMSWDVKDRAFQFTAIKRKQ